MFLRLRPLWGEILKNVFLVSLSHLTLWAVKGVFRQILRLRDVHKFDLY